MRQLFPGSPEPVDPVAVYADVPDGPDRGGRPFLRLNMIASVDGATAIGGRSGALGGPADHRVFMVLRSLADAILVAAGTMRAEGYGPAVLPVDVQDVRRARRQVPVPPIAVVSRSCALDWDSPFFTAATARPLVVTVSAAPAANRARAAEVADVVIAGEADVDFRQAVAALGDRGAASVLAEGGPSLNGQLARAGVLDEICLSVAPKLAGGDSHRIVTGAGPDTPLALEPVSILEDSGYLFLRYRLRTG
jgi:riboflavin biosynthesis pyrimidine reductase